MKSFCTLSLTLAIICLLSLLIPSSHAASRRLLQVAEAQQPPPLTLNNTNLNLDGGGTTTDDQAAHGDSVDNEESKVFDQVSKDLGLSSDEINELKRLKQGAGGKVLPSFRHDLGGPDKPLDEEVEQPNKPHEPLNDSVKSMNDSDSDASDRSDLNEQIARCTKEAESLASKNEQLRVTLEQSKQQVRVVKDQMTVLKAALERSRGAFQKSLDSAKSDHESERTEMTATIEEQKRAFNELYEEKMLLSHILSDEQKTLRELQDKIRHPDLGLWLRQRAEKAAVFMETPETDVVKFYAKKYMAPEVKKMKHRLSLLERRVERTVDHLLPAKYGAFVAILLCIGLIGFPCMVTMSTVVNVSKAVSIRQYVLLGNVFLTAFALGLCIAGLLLQQDPLQTLYEANDGLFITLQLAIAIVYPLFLLAIAVTVKRGRDRMDSFVFGCEFVFYSVVGLNYHSRVWKPAMLGQNIETGVMMYVVYVMDFLSMTALTMSSARTEGHATNSDLEIGKMVPDVSGAIQGLRASRIVGLGSGLLQGAMGGTGSGKEE